MSPEINQGIRDAIARAVKGEFVRWDTPLHASPDGSVTIIIDASVMPVKDDQGNVVFLACEGRDITEKKAQEREIAQKNSDLHWLLERIRELDEIKTQFFANVSHELRTPLALILGPAQRLIDDVGMMSVAERRESGQVIARNARMLLKHVNDLLDMAKVESGKHTLELHAADVAALVRFLASHFAVLAADRGIEYTVDAASPCVAAIDPDKLQRVMMNVLGNAFKFVPDGGRIRCSLRHSAAEITIAVDDSGPGVKPELRQAIFERFRQGDGGTSRTVAGTGLGLAIAKEFVEMHKGRIDVLDSSLGGARFEVELPMGRIGPDDPLTEVRLDRLVLDGVLEELRSTGTGPKEAASKPALVAADRQRVLVEDKLGDQARAAAESANRAKDEFLAILGHELRNPLSAILTALQLMKLRGEPGSERERTVIERQVNHLTRLVDDLLDVSRIAQGRLELKTEIVEVAEVVAKAVEMASPLLEQRHHTLTMDVPRRGLLVNGDTTRLGQVISNLLTNAAKYTESHGVVAVACEADG